MADWQDEAKRLKFIEATSWTDLTVLMRPYFEGLSDKQILERVRSYLRRCTEYHAMKPQKNRTHFTYISAGEVHVYIIADVHKGAHGFCEKAFKRYIAKIKADPLAVVIILGDLIDNATQGSKGCMFSQREMPQKQIETIISMLYPIRDKIIFFCIGNHEERTFRQTGSDPGYTMCLGLGCLDKYNYVQGYISITACGQTYKFYVTHNIGKSENKLKTTARAHPDCDFVLGAHIHEAKVVPVDQQLYSGKIRTQYAVTSTAWIADESYAISAAYEPLGIRPPVIVLNEEKKVIQ